MDTQTTQSRGLRARIHDRLELMPEQQFNRAMLIAIFGTGVIFDLGVIVAIVVAVTR